MYVTSRRRARSFYVEGKGDFCKSGQVTGKSGPYSYPVCLKDGRVFRRHRDNLRKIVDKEGLESVSIVLPLPEGVE